MLIGSPLFIEKPFKVYATLNYPNFSYYAQPGVIGKIIDISVQGELTWIGFKEFENTQTLWIKTEFSEGINIDKMDLNALQKKALKDVLDNPTKNTSVNNGYGLGLLVGKGLSFSIFSILKYFGFILIIAIFLILRKMFKK